MCTFLTALMVEYVHDQVADSAASEYNVTWTRTHPIAVSVGDDAYQTYLTLECDHSMGMTVAGSLKNIILFNYACSSSITFIEYAVMDNLGYGQITTMDTSVNSVMLDLINEYLNNSTSLKYFIQNGYFIVSDRHNNSLVIDSETGIMRDINTANNYYGAYCFHDQLTYQSQGLGEDLNHGEKQFNWNKFSHITHGASIMLLEAGAMILGAAGSETIVAIALIYPGTIALYDGGSEIIDHMDDPTWI